ncbi:MAG: VWA domain-containing protein [Gammaproteobacteria bacterium]
MRLGLTALLIAATAAMHVAAEAQQARPLTVEGKRALYQRVIAVPGAMLLDAPGASTAYAQPVTPFTVFYVYGRETSDGRTYVQVGVDSNGRIDGWLPAEQAVDWQQTLTIGFKDPAEHPRVLLFENRDALKRLVDTNDVAGYEALREQAIAGNVEGTPIAAIQPDGFIDIRRNFYLVPILSHEDVLIGPHQGRLLRVASVPLRDPANDPYRAAIVFVIDTTQSMRPYIERTREIMRDVYAEIEQAGLSDKVAYGLVGFRDSTDAVPQLGYVSRVFATLTGSGDEFLSQVAAVDASNISSEGFNEDAYAGVLEAIESMNWRDYFARYIILITDAGPRLADDPRATTGLDTSDLAARLSDLRIALWTIHLKTEVGRETHAFAEQEYRALSTVPGIGSFYYPIEAGDVDDFGEALGAMMRQLTAQVAAAAQGFQPLQSMPAIDSGADGELSAFQQKVARLGYALRMDYLQQTDDGGAPALFDAWMIDRDLADPDERSIDVRVLLTRDQLSDLHDVLRRVVERAEEGALAPQSFLDELRSLAAIISRDPEAVQAAVGGGTTLAELGYMREYIEGLPYQSEVMHIDLSDWQQWSAAQQFEFINQLDSKVAYYRALHDNVDLWVSLDGGPVDGDSVYPLLLEALP